ncbi:ribosome silencing factor [Puniceicoccaceae bacterium K14]|nr:ribosome silencing factor [Puniceicoccaceae bacterium K14]
MTDKRSLTPDNQKILKLCCTALDGTKAENLAILDVREQSSITNFIILATANSHPHLKALKRDLDAILKEHNIMIIGSDEGDFSGWSVVDAFDVMIHLFTPETRENYSLETLWKDAAPIGTKEFIPAPPER